MSRLVDLSPFDDELPLVESQSQQTPYTRQSCVGTPIRQKQLLPRGASKSSARKVRLLGPRHQETPNILFQRRVPADEGSTAKARGALRQSPKKKIKAWKKSLAEQESEVEPSPASNLSPPIATTRHAMRGPRISSYEDSVDTIELQSSSKQRDFVDQDDQFPGQADTTASLLYQRGYSSSQNSDESLSFFSCSTDKEVAGFIEARESISSPRQHRKLGIGCQDKLEDAADRSADDFVHASGESRNTSESQEVAADTFILAKSLAQLRLDVVNQAEVGRHDDQNIAIALARPCTPTRPGSSQKLVSPRKPLPIPQPPHQPNTDTFWSQGSTNDWNDQHSPKKPSIRPVITRVVKDSPHKSIRKVFDAVKGDMALAFLEELDTKITDGQIAKLTQSTGGVNIVWSKTLQTTAGRATWKRETITTKTANGTTTSVTHKHHTSIQLAEKVIDDETKLMNVVAHEFCHLANYMISGIVANPHGKQFKEWAAKCSLHFGYRGINVTTKHSYDIDFKYIWQCADCCAEYKRHSRSISPDRHQCAKCSGKLKQTKPMPRTQGKLSNYQIFFKEQMKIVKEQNPGKPQKEIMKIISERWAEKSGVGRHVEPGVDLIESMQELRLAS